MLVKFLRNPQICSIGNIFYSLEPVLFPRTVRRNRTVDNRGVDALPQFFHIAEALHIFPYEFSLDFHIFQGSLYTSKGKRESGNGLSCILAIYSLYCRCAFGRCWIESQNCRNADKEKAPCFTSPLMVGALLTRDGLGYRGTSPALGGPRPSSGSGRTSE